MKAMLAFYNFFLFSLIRCVRVRVRVRVRVTCACACA